MRSASRHKFMRQYLMLVEFALLGESWDEEGATKIEFALSSVF